MKDVNIDLYYITRNFVICRHMEHAAFFSVGEPTVLWAVHGNLTHFVMEISGKVATCKTED